MVSSKINKNVNYQELKTVDPRDLKQESNTYQIYVLGTDIVIAIGNPKKEFEDQNIIYFPIYLVRRKRKVTQIGVFEIPSDVNYLDEKQELDVTKLPVDKPLLYNFVTKEYLHKKRMIPSTTLTRLGLKKEEEEEEEKESQEQEEAEEESTKKNEKPFIPEERADIFVFTKGSIVPPDLPTESKKEVQQIKSTYKLEPNDSWIQQFMKNRNFGIIENEGGGDCLFASIRDAFSSIAQQTTVDKIRNKLANEFDVNVFLSYKDMYDSLQISLVESSNKIKELSTEYEKLQSKFASSSDRNERKHLLEAAKKIKSQHDGLVNEKKITSKLHADLKFMKGVETLDQMKKKIKSCEFWADQTAISTLERMLNVKFIILSSEAYKDKDTFNVLQCGPLLDKVLSNKGVFLPEYYILVDFTGTHYKLISYKDKQIFHFSEIPYDVKKLIVDKCMEENSGVFSLIPDFQQLKQKKKKKNEKRKNKKRQVGGYTEGDEDDDSMGEEKEVNYDDLTEAKLRGLFDDSIVFMFYSKSGDKPLPGRGSGETIPMEKIKEYVELASVPQWRKKMSDYYVLEKDPFLLDDKRWASSAHYILGSQYKKMSPDFYLSFSRDSGTEIGKNPFIAKAACSDNGMYKGRLLRPVEVEVDPDYNSKREENEKMKARMAKFSQCAEMKKLLLATKNAKLVSFRKGKKPVLLNDLMLIREKLSKLDQPEQTEGSQIQYVEL